MYFNFVLNSKDSKDEIWLLFFKASFRNRFPLFSVELMTMFAAPHLPATLPKAGDSTACLQIKLLSLKNDTEWLAFFSCSFLTGEKKSTLDKSWHSEWYYPIRMHTGTHRHTKYMHTCAHTHMWKKLLGWKSRNKSLSKNTLLNRV